jgi:hypothetical protein
MKKVLLVSLLVLFSCGQRSSTEFFSTNPLVGVWVSYDEQLVEFTSNEMIVADSFDAKNRTAQKQNSYIYKMISDDKFQLFDSGNSLKLDNEMVDVIYHFEINGDKLFIRDYEELDDSFEFFRYEHEVNYY